MTKNVIKETYLVRLPFAGRIVSAIQYFSDNTNAIMYCNGETKEERLAKEPDLIEWNAEEFDAQYTVYLNTLVTSAARITEEQFDEWLNCLPPSRWSTVDGINSFHICERLTANLVQWCAKVGNNYFGFTDYDNISKETVNAKVQAALTYKD